MKYHEIIYIYLLFFWFFLPKIARHARLVESLPSDVSVLTGGLPGVQDQFLAQAIKIKWRVFVVCVFYVFCLTWLPFDLWIWCRKMVYHWSTVQHFITRSIWWNRWVPMAFSTSRGWAERHGSMWLCHFYASTSIIVAAEVKDMFLQCKVPTKSIKILQQKWFSCQKILEAALFFWGIWCILARNEARRVDVRWRNIHQESAGYYLAQGSKNKWYNNMIACEINISCHNFMIFHTRQKKKKNMIIKYQYQNLHLLYCLKKGNVYGHQGYVYGDDLVAGVDAAERRKVFSRVGVIFLWEKALGICVLYHLCCIKT